MATATHRRVRGRAAQPPGPTFLTYTPNGKKLITVGISNVIRVYQTGSDDEPVNIDDCQENNTAVAATNDYFVTGSEDGTVCLYSLATSQYEKMLTRSSLPIRDVAVSPDSKWVAVASDELVIKIVDIEDPLNIQYIRDCRKSPKHLEFHPSGSYLAASCTDGIVYIYSLSASEPRLVREVDGVTRALNGDVETSSKAAWHPDGRAFGAPTATREIQVVSREDGSTQKSFTNGHMGDITTLAWSPNGALLATAATDGKIIIWDSKTQKVLERYDFAKVTSFVWHPTQNIVSFTTSDGEAFIHPEFLSPELSPSLELSLQPAPFSKEPLGEISGNAQKQTPNGDKAVPQARAQRRGTPDDLDDILGSDADEEDDFVVDDDGAGYALNANGKRANGHLDDVDGFGSKRHAGPGIWQPKIHEAFQHGSTPWRGNRRYLCLNLTGFVWAVNQDTHHTVTVEFYDRELHRDFHFTDPYRYDKACLNENGTLLSCPPSETNPAMIYYRPHETWTARADWRTELPEGENISSLALSESYIVVTTTANYVRVYTLYGTPVRIYRQKSSPAVTCAAWRDYVLTMGNGPVGANGSTTLLYSIENVRRGEMCQSEDVVALPDDTEAESVFFSDAGDPCVYDSRGVLLVLEHWRSAGQAKWVPLLDTRQLERLADGRKEETYWPVAVAQEKFHCIILKGGDKYPYFPRPLLTEFEFRIPFSRPQPPKPRKDDDGEETFDQTEGPKLEEQFMRHSLMHSLLGSLVSATNATREQRSDLARKELEINKTLLQLLNVECREGEEKGMKALEIAGLIRDESGKMLEAASKIANRYGRTVLEDKIRDLAERRFTAEDDEDML